MIDVFRIGVHLGFTSNEGEVLSAMLRRLGEVHVEAEKLNTSLKGIKLAAIGAIGAFAGFKALTGIWDMVKASKDLNTELDRTVQLGGAFASTIGQQRAAAFAVAQSVPTSTPSGNVKLLRELGTQLSSPEEAMQILPYAARFAWVMKQFTGRDAEGSMQTAIKVADLRGNIITRGPNGEERIDPTKFGKELDAMSRGIRLSGGLATPEQFLAFAKQSGLAGKLMSPEAFYGVGAEAIAAMGGARAGTASMSLLQQFLGGTMTRRTAEEMQKMGLLHAGEWHAARGGAIVMKDSATRRFSAMAKDPDAYIMNTLVPEMEKHGKKGQDLLIEIFRLFGRQTTQRFAAELIQNNPQFARARKLYPEVMNAEDTYKFLMDHDLDTNLDALTAAWKGFDEALGSSGIPLTIEILHGLTNALHELTALAEAHPTMARWLLEGAAGVSVLMIALGGLAVVRFAIMASGVAQMAKTLVALAAAIPGATGALGALAAVISRLAAPLSFLYFMWPKELNGGRDPDNPSQSMEMRQLKAAEEKMHAAEITVTARRPHAAHHFGHHQLHAPHHVPPHHPLHPAAHQHIPPHHVHLTVDGKKLASVVLDHWGRVLNLPGAGITGFDGSMSPLYPGDGNAYS